jgi:hypothetical protein
MVNLMITQKYAISSLKAANLSDNSSLRLLQQRGGMEDEKLEYGTI